MGAFLAAFAAPRGIRGESLQSGQRSEDMSALRRPDCKDFSSGALSRGWMARARRSEGGLHARNGFGEFPARARGGVHVWACMAGGGRSPRVGTAREFVVSCPLGPCGLRVRATDGAWPVDGTDG